MDVFQKKYGVKEDKTTIDFHKSRRMFCVYKGELKIANENLPYSHAEWFELEGWMSKEDDSLMEQIVRGYVDKDGNIHFYIGYDFRVDEDVEKIFFEYMDELIASCCIDRENCRIYGGAIRNNGEWKQRKEYNI